MAKSYFTAAQALEALAKGRTLFLVFGVHSMVWVDCPGRPSLRWSSFRSLRRRDLIKLGRKIPNRFYLHRFHLSEKGKAEVREQRAKKRRKL